MWGKNKHTSAVASLFHRLTLGATFSTIAFCTIGYSVNTYADFLNPGAMIRWTAAEDRNASIDHILTVLHQKTGIRYQQSQFLLQEDRDLAYNHYQRWVQLAEGIPIHGKSIRVWKELNSDTVVQVEATLDNPHVIAAYSATLRSAQKNVTELRQDLSQEETIDIIRKTVSQRTDDPFIRGIQWRDEWKEGELTRSVKVKGKRGYHLIGIRLRDQRVVSDLHQEFPQDDTEFSVNAQVFPVYEQFDGDSPIQNRIPVRLTHLKKEVPVAQGDIYASLKNRHYYDFDYNPTLGDFPEEIAKNSWSMASVKVQAEKIRSNLPKRANDWTNGVLLQGRYATINIHPDAVTQFQVSGFTPQISPALFPNWVDTTLNGKAVSEMIPSTAFYGKPLTSPEEAWNRPARRLVDHDPGSYMNDGFDEIQVYYAINTLFTQLKKRGFIDPELSTRPFNAFLFNPDIAYRNNAFYTDDTINFTTYSGSERNDARDNSTVWHELGHGVMDRLMGDHIELADTGGLSEGMADLVAALVIQAVTHGESFSGSDKFRIINHTGFYLTNEVHDDGEAYGGAMKDFLDSVIREKGALGLKQVTDVILETMRLTRDYPGLTAPEWFKHLLFADSLGRPGVRQPNELKGHLMQALAARNFRIDGGPVATFALVNTEDGEEVVADGPGSRNNPIPLKMAPTETRKFQLTAQVKNSDEYGFKFPVQVKVEYKSGALQGAIHWAGKANNPEVYTLNSEADVASIPLEVSGKCDEVNRADGSCVDYAYVQIWNNGETDRPVAKKRFYLRIKN